MRQKRAHINLNAQTKDVLDSIRAPGQSYDGIIQELIVLSERANSRKQVNSIREKEDGVTQKRSC